ncbi:tripartite motif-containing protein 10-like [Diadema antillarum]|uniref:tripartite motif-containing protein 10-like n=1 Tax=Diadema antillarum TaxID=105358 RepID=UPI003A85EE04
MDLVKELNEELMCPICHDVIQDAKMLECGHTFCNVCIDRTIEITQQRDEDWEINGIACPCCRLPSLPGELLPKNWMVDNIISVIDSFQNNAASNMCSRHRMNEMKYYCERCEVLVCSDCVIEDHYNHRKRPKSLDEMTEIISKKMEALMERCREREAVLDEFKAIGMRLGGEKSPLLDIATKKSQLRSFVDKRMSVVKKVTLRLTQTRIEATNRLSEGSKAEIVTSYKNWAKKLKKDMKNQNPSNF